MTPLSGLSGGGFTSAFLSLGKNGTEQKEFFQRVIARCANSSTACVGQLNGHMEDLLSSAIPEDAAELVNGHLRVAMSQLDVTKATLNGSASWIIDDFSDKASSCCSLATLLYRLLYRAQPEPNQLPSSGATCVSAGWRAGRQCGGDMAAACACLHDPACRLRRNPYWHPSRSNVAVGPGLRALLDRRELRPCWCVV